MKKLIAVLLVLFAFGVAQAGEQVYIQAPDNPGIPAGSCQAISQIILGLSGNVTLRAGDTGQFNLPVGITVCKDIDFFVGNSGSRISAATPVGSYGPVELFKAPFAGGGLGVYIRVQAVTGSQSVVLTVVGDSTADFVQMGGGDKELALRIRLFDRAIWTGFIPSTKYMANRCSNWLYTDGNGDGYVFGNAGANVDLPMCTPITTDKNDDNAICIQTPANWTALITAAFESQDILNPGIPKWDYTNDPGFESGDNVIYVANILSALAFQCLPICKVEDWDYVPIATVGPQATGTCVFDYWTGLNYCNTAGWNGNHLAIKKSSNFSSGDYELQVTITGNGSYFDCGGLTGVWGYPLGTSNDDVCTTAGVNVVDLPSPYFFTSGGPATACVGGDTDCDVGINNRVTRIVFDLGALNPYAILAVRFPQVIYTLADVASGDEVEVTLDLIKKPCGSIFTCTEKIAEYIDSCVSAPGPADCWSFPYFPPINDAVWWNGAAFANCSNGNATCNLTFYESDGDIGTYTLNLGPYGAWSGLWTSIAASIVPDAGNAGTLGDATFFICICCQPGAGAAAGSPVSALGMMGTGDQAHGYDLNAY